MPAYSFQKAKDLLSPKEMERLACMMLVKLEQNKITGKEHEIAGKEFGGTKDSFNFAWRAMIKKLKDGGAEVDNLGGEAGASTESGDGKKGKTAGTPKKRKTGGEGEEDDEAGVKTPKSAKSAKVKKEPVAEEGANGLDEWAD